MTISGDWGKKMNRSVEVAKGSVWIDGKAVRLISGAIHYFRVHPGLWDDRLEKAAAFGNSFNNAVIPDIETVFTFEIFGFAVNKVEHGQGKRKLVGTGFSAGNIKL